MKQKSEKPQKPTPLTPPDRDQCQVDKPNGHSFMTLGGVPSMVRCRNEPIFIATEREPGEDGRKGSMSICAPCLLKLYEQLGRNHVDLEIIGEHVIQASP